MHGLMMLRSGRFSLLLSQDRGKHIEAEYADISYPVERTKALIDRLQSKWLSPTADQAMACVQVFEQTD